MNRLPMYVMGLVALALVALVASPLLANNVVGTVKTVTADQNQLVLTDQNGRDWTFQIVQNAQIQSGNNNQARLADLRAGQTVNITYELQNNQLVASAIRGQQGQQGQQAAQQAQQGQQQAQQNAQGQQQQAAQEQQQGQRAQQAQQQARGMITNVNADKNQFTLKDQKGHELTFQAGRDARVQINDKEAKLADLQQGQEVSVTYRQILTDIRAGEKNDANQDAQQKAQTVRGQIQRVQADQRQLSLRDQNGKEHTFQIGQNASVQLNGRNATLADLQQGQEVTATRQMVANEVRTGQQNQNQNQNNR